MSELSTCPRCGMPVPPGVLEGLCPACLLQEGAAESGGGSEAFRFAPPPVGEIAKLFPQLEVLKLIGRGGMGAIYQARQPTLDRMVALKLLPPPAAGSPDFSERFNREARALARLVHPNIVAVHEFGRVRDWHYFLMEYVDGANLRQMERAGRLSPREALAIIPQICDALQYAHDEGVVHRDIKPENVLVDRKGRIKIADFGLAKMLRADPESVRLTCEGQVMGTPHYMAPEQVEHPLEVDHRADIYSLGVVFYEMLTGELPLGRFAPPSRRVQLDVRLDEVVLRTLEKDPEHRYQRATEVKTQVEEIANTPQQHDRPPLLPADPPSPAPDLDQRIRFAAKAGGALFLTVALGVLLISFLFLPQRYVGVTTLSLHKSEPESLQEERAPDPFFIQTEVAKIQSRMVLQPVVTRHSLTVLWAQQYNIPGGLTALECTELLKRRLEVRQLPNSALVDIRFYAPDRGEAAAIANSIADVYQELSKPGRVEIIDRAAPSRRPSRPNHLTNLFLGVIGGGILGAIGAATTFLAHRPPVKPLGGTQRPASGHARGGKWRPRVLGTICLAATTAFGVTLWQDAQRNRQPNLIVSGVVTDAVSGQPIVRARVADHRYHAGWDRPLQEAWTDVAGRYLLHTWYEEHSLAASAPAHQTTFQTLLTKPFAMEQHLNMNFQLRPGPP